MSKEGINTEIIHLGGSYLHGCKACTKCYTTYIDRCSIVARANNDALHGKAWAPVIAMRRAGGTFAYAAVNFFYDYKVASA